MSPFRRHDDDADTDEDDAVDPELRLRTVRTAASTIAESNRQEERTQRRKSVRKKGSRFFRRDKKKSETADPEPPTSTPHISGRRRNVYVNSTLPLDEVDHNGEPIVRYARNKVRTSSEYAHSSSPCRP